MRAPADLSNEAMPRKSCLSLASGRNAPAKSTTAGCAVAAVFALQHQADAAVVYTNPTDVVASIGSGLGNATAQFDIDGVGGNDFIINVQRHNYTSGVFYGYARFGGIGSLNGFVRNANYNPKKLASGAMISAAQPFLNSNTRVLRQFNNGVPNDGTWASNATGFAGVRFQTGANTYYGWVRMKWNDSADGNPDPNSITVMDWAYNDTPGASILAGDMGAVPEPSRALLALAGAGAAFLRRRRKTV
jgi:hypothetical protein